MQFNKRAVGPHPVTQGGVPAYAHISPVHQLRRLVMSCLLWESEFYVDGKTIADNILEAAEKVTPEQLAQIAVEARSVHNLRHVPLLLLSVLAKRGAKRSDNLVSKTIEATVQRADELTEFLAVYWRNGKTPVAKQVKKGLGAAFGKYNEYALQKYDREKAIKLRDVLRIVRPTPKDEEQSALWKRVVKGELAPAQTWEQRLSAGQDKKAVWESMLMEGELGYLAVLRNCKNFERANVDPTLVRRAILARKGAHRVLPFRYVAAARAAPQFEPYIDEALCEAISDLPILLGRTVVMVDVSASMDAPLSAKSDLRRCDAAAALASLINGDVRVFSFSNQLVEVPPRRGMAGVDAILRSQPHGGTALGHAVAKINQTVPHDRLIVITDEQATDTRVVDPVVTKGYCINVASYQNGIGYGKWVHVDGFSEGVLRWMVEYESMEGK